MNTFLRGIGMMLALCITVGTGICGLGGLIVGVEEFFQGSSSNFISSLMFGSAFSSIAFIFAKIFKSLWQKGTPYNRDDDPKAPPPFP